MNTMEPFVRLIEAKRDGAALTPEQIRRVVRDFTAGVIPDYQMAAFLMAIIFRGLSAAETAELTLAMRDSGDTLQFPDDERPLVDKHSTGGVGDKVSLPLAPLLACLGFRVPMISGRGLGLTGGTLDKLESIPGLTTTLPAERMVEQVQRLGVAIAGQTERMVPADKLMYALRDVTGTVPSIPLITASILSKKFAEGLQALVMDIKFGRAAFMADLTQARELASGMSELSTRCGVTFQALLTNMDAPLGRAAGNWLEIKETMACLEGHGPPDLQQLVIECAARLLVMTRRSPDLPAARAAAADVLASGLPRQRWLEMIVAQGADLPAFEAKLKADVTAPCFYEVRLESHLEHPVHVAQVDARLVGELVRDLGAGRQHKHSVIHPDTGVDHLAKPGDRIYGGQLLGRIHARNVEEARAAASQLKQAIIFSETPVVPPPLIHPFPADAA